MSIAEKKETQKEKTKEPKKWNVIFHNDDFTSFELVEVLLITIFNKTPEESMAIATTIHQQGRGIVGTYSKEIAETKQQHAIELALHNQAPLLITIEQA